MSYKTSYGCIVGLAVSSLAIGSHLMAMEIKRPSLMAAAKLGNIRVFHKDNKFVVERDGEKKNIQSCFVSPIIRNANSDLLSKFLVANGYLRLNELKGANGSIDYKLDACGRLNGGGAGGATVGFFGGKAATHVVGHGTIWTIAWGIGLFCPPAGAAVGFALEGVLAIPIETASNVVGLGCGIILGSATGPV